jgi:hypothetical protein
MTLTEVMRKAKQKLQEQKTTIANDMVSGRMTDFNGYTRNVGVAEGLQQACDIIDEFIKKLDEEDE